MSETPTRKEAVAVGLPPQLGTCTTSTRYGRLLAWKCLSMSTGESSSKLSKKMGTSSTEPSSPAASVV
jgi:hypothetical protein